MLWIVVMLLLLLLRGRRRRWWRRHGNWHSCTGRLGGWAGGWLYGRHVETLGTHCSSILVVLRLVLLRFTKLLHRVRYKRAQANLVVFPVLIPLLPLALYIGG